MENVKLVTVIIVNWNTKSDLLNCICSLVNSSMSKSLYISVVDNASSDGSVQALSSMYPGVKIIESRGNIGFGRANNLALEQVKSKYTLLLNPDTIVGNDSISKMLKVIESDQHIGAVGCKMIYSDGKAQPLGLQWFPNPITELISILFLTSKTIKIFKGLLPYHNPCTSGYVKKLYGGCLLVKTDVMQAVGGFDKRFFMYGEDVDLCRKITDSGKTLFYTAQAEVIHLCGQSSKKAPSTFSIVVKCESIYKLMRKYYGYAGGSLYRALVFLGASVRIAVILIMSPLLLLFPPANISNGLIKYASMFLWSVGAKKTEK